MERPRLLLTGAVAAVAGGAMWVIKGGVILAVGDQPPLLFELAGALFPVALIGLHASLEGKGGRRARVGGALARVSGAMVMAAASYSLLASKPSELVLGLLLGVSGLSLVIGLLVLGLAARSLDVLPPRWTNLPAVMGAAAVPAMTVVAGILEAIHERLLELPIMAFGIAWILLGRVLWLARGADEPDPAVATSGGPAPA